MGKSTTPRFEVYLGLNLSGEGELGVSPYMRKPVSKENDPNQNAPDSGVPSQDLWQESPLVRPLSRFHLAVAQKTGIPKWLTWQVETWVPKPAVRPSHRPILSRTQPPIFDAAPAPRLEGFGILGVDLHQELWDAGLDPDLAAVRVPSRAEDKTRRTRRAPDPARAGAASVSPGSQEYAENFPAGNKFVSGPRFSFFLGGERWGRRWRFFKPDHNVFHFAIPTRAYQGRGQRSPRLRPSLLPVSNQIVPLCPVLKALDLQLRFQATDCGSTADFWVAAFKQRISFEWDIPTPGFPFEGQGALGRLPPPPEHSVNDRFHGFELDATFFDQMASVGKMKAVVSNKNPTNKNSPRPSESKRPLPAFNPFPNRTDSLRPTPAAQQCGPFWGVLPNLSNTQLDGIVQKNGSA